MTTSEQQRKAQALRELHSAGKLLVLPNVWDPVGARVLVATGYRAVATASAAISASLGFQDGERIYRSTMLAVVSRIAHAVDVPVTADMESGYGATIGELEETTRALIESGAVGLNIEDSLPEGGALRPIREQAERIGTVRAAAAARGIPLVINARIDTLLEGEASERERQIEETIERAAAYAEAGADCVYPIGPGDEATLNVLRARIASPINVLATPAAAPLETMAAIGINRVSFGPFIFRSCLRKFSDIASALARLEGYECFSRETLTRDEASAYLTPERERGLSPQPANGSPDDD
jgi:2-methylisocitrate lyase-like PEP mutase family enzyme